MHLLDRMGSNYLQLNSDMVESEAPRTDYRAEFTVYAL
jgi:hypothetical protein